jgi:hypothetical protein
MGLLLLWLGARGAAAGLGQARGRDRSHWYGDASIPGAVAGTVSGYNRAAVLKSLIRTLRGPSRDPRMAYISRPLPRDLPDEQVLEALDLAFQEDPDPAYLVETLPPALRKVTGRESLQVLDRSVRDVTGAFAKTMVMIRDGDVGRWPGYAAMSYPLLVPSSKAEETLAAIIAADAAGDDGAPAERKPGWEPPPPPERG